MTQPTPAPQRRRRFRQPSAVVLGLIVCIGALLLVIASGWDSDGIGLTLLFLAVVPVTAALLIWPSVELDEHGVLLRNVGLDTFIPWHLVDDCETRWNLRVWTLEKAYTAWAISVSRRGSMPEHHMMTASLNPMYIGRPGRIDEAARAGADRHARKVHAVSVADAIEAGKQEYDSLVSGGMLAPTTGPVRRPVSLVSAGLLGGAVLLAVIGAVLLAL